MGLIPIDTNLSNIDLLSPALAVLKSYLLLFIYIIIETRDKRWLDQVVDDLQQEWPAWLL